MLDFEQAISKEFKVRLLGEAKPFLGMEITKNSQKGTVEITQKKYIKNIVAVVLSSILVGKTLDSVRENLAQINLSQKKLTSENKNYEVKTSSLLTNLNFTKMGKQRMESHSRIQAQSILSQTIATSLPNLGPLW